MKLACNDGDLLCTLYRYIQSWARANCQHRANALRLLWHAKIKKIRSGYIVFKSRTANLLLRTTSSTFHIVFRIWTPDRIGTRFDPGEVLCTTIEPPYLFLCKMLGAYSLDVCMITAWLSSYTSLSLRSIWKRNANLPRIFPRWSG